VFHGNDILERRGDRGRLVDLGKHVLPGAIHLQMRFDSHYRFAQAFVWVIAGAQLMYIAKDRFDWGGVHCCPASTGDT